MRILGVGVLVVGVLVVGVLVATVLGGSPSSASPANRVVGIVTTACGHSSATSGTGVIIDDGRVLTTAHTVSGAASVSVDASRHRLASTIEVLDFQADLAILRVPGVQAPPIELAEVGTGDSLSMVSAGPLGVVDVTVTRRVEVRIEEVRSNERAARLSIEFDTRVALGDSGAGVYDGDGRLGGVVYGRSQTRADRSFASRSDEIQRVLATDPGHYECDPAAHRVIAGVAR